MPDNNDRTDADAELVRAWRGLTALLDEVHHPTSSRLYDDQVRLQEAIHKSALI
jgi:hypothetical protein